MIKCNHLRKVIINPCLTAINMYSLDAEEFLIATAANETLGGTYLVQEFALHQPETKGALGIYGMEAPTYEDIWDRVISKRSALKEKILKACHFQENVKPPATEMIGNLNYATIMARISLVRFPEILPNAKDSNAIWGYYKKYWNTSLGAATKAAFMHNYKLLSSA